MDFTITKPIKTTLNTLKAGDYILDHTIPKYAKNQHGQTVPQPGIFEWEVAHVTEDKVILKGDPLIDTAYHKNTRFNESLTKHYINHIPYDRTGTLPATNGLKQSTIEVQETLTSPLFRHYLRKYGTQLRPITLEESYSLMPIIGTKNILWPELHDIYKERAQNYMDEFLATVMEEAHDAAINGDQYYEAPGFYIDYGGVYLPIDVWVYLLEIEEITDKYLILEEYWVNSDGSKDNYWDLSNSANNTNDLLRGTESTLNMIICLELPLNTPIYSNKGGPHSLFTPGN